MYIYMYIVYTYVYIYIHIYILQYRLYGTGKKCFSLIWDLRLVNAC